MGREQIVCDGLNQAYLRDKMLEYYFGKTPHIRYTGRCRHVHRFIWGIGTRFKLVISIAGAWKQKVSH